MEGLNIQISSYQYKHFHYKDKTVSRSGPPYIQNRNPMLEKKVFIWERVPDSGIRQVLPRGRQPVNFFVIGGPDYHHMTVTCDNHPGHPFESPPETMEDQKGVKVDYYKWLSKHLMLLTYRSLASAARSLWRRFLNQLDTWVVVSPVASASSRFSRGDGYGLWAYHSRNTVRDFSLKQ